MATSSSLDSTTTSRNTPQIKTTLSHSSLSPPSLIVFDLDNTLWTPELYQLRRKYGTMTTPPVANHHVSLFPAAKNVIEALRTARSSNERWHGTRFAVASRTKSVEWALDLLSQFELDSFFDFVEVFPGDKQRHFVNLRERSGVSFDEMMFFDDSRDGRFGNCVPVSELGVLSVHCPQGLHCESIWNRALECYETWRSGSEGMMQGPGQPRPGAIVEWEGSLTILSAGKETDEINEEMKGTVKMVNQERQFGFISIDYKKGQKKQGDIFFHFSNLLPNRNHPIDIGNKVSFTVTTDTQRGKKTAKNVSVVNGTSGISTSSSSSSVNGAPASSNSNTITLPTFSMNQPFAALLANGYKTLETRNGTMFTSYPAGTKMFLHVGRRTYPDNNRHLEIMKRAAMETRQIERLKSLPEGYSRGAVVAILEVGETFETTLEERCEEGFECKVGAYGADSGRMVTEIRRVEYLKREVRVPGKGGVFNVEVERDLIPDGWI